MTEHNRTRRHDTVAATKSKSLDYHKGQKVLGEALVHERGKLTFVRDDLI
jgi:hypothetical protein